MIVGKGGAAGAGQGLRGDRYFLQLGSFNRRECFSHGRQVSLISLDAIALCNQRLGLALPTAAFRRNLVIADLDVTQLLGQEFWIGDVRFKGLRHCHPCRLLSRLTGADMMAALKGLGGIRAEILDSGRLNVGDRLSVQQ
ncbi:MOSC domain-containing protein [Zobellella maritima]|uniref:MOSC domain-containing protein n=1 Tax=Zobellella maritima TaxID=2059725 RepID=UPI0013004247|nr:MOSC domain-containing protein [Zobellella maritima]